MKPGPVIGVESVLAILFIAMVPKENYFNEWQKSNREGYCLR